MTDEQKLVNDCLKGDRIAQKQLFDRLAPLMLSVCLRYVGDRATAEDLLQDGFVALFSKLETYKGDGSFEGWARKIFVNTALMFLRKKDALKMSERELCLMRSITSWSPAMNPPSDPKLLENVPMMRSVLSVRP